MSTSTPQYAALNAEQRRFIDALIQIGNNSAVERIARAAGMSVHDAQKVIDSLPPGWVHTYQLNHYPRMVALTFSGRKALGRPNTG
jgi:hypothetical protein